MKPNILYIHSHDTGRYIQPYGHAVPTPNLQRFAEQGVLFRSCFCANPTCSPSRACLLTGQWAHCNGMYGLAHRGFTFDYSHHLANFLCSQGYTTALAGIQHEASLPFADPRKLGYQRFLNHNAEFHQDDNTAHAAIRFLHQRNQPFFLSVGFSETHRDFPAMSLEFDPRYTLPPAPLPDTPQSRADMAAFKTSARRLDEKMGAVLAALAANGLADTTLVICTTDHGIAFPNMKCSLTDHGLGVMLMLRGPGGFCDGKVCDAMVSHIDLFPTVCRVIGTDIPTWVQGQSLLPLVDGRATQLNDAIFAEVNCHAAYEPMRSVRTARWKYIRRYDDAAPPPLILRDELGQAGWKLPPGPVLPNCDESLSKDLWLEQGWMQQARAKEELYDLSFDPVETQNLVAAPSAADALAEMRARLERWMRESSDPLLSGPLPIPKGALLTDPLGATPKDRVLTVGD